MSESADSILDHPISRPAMALAVAFLVNDLNYTKYMALTTAQQIALGATWGLSVETLTKTILEVGELVRARNEALALRAVTPGTSGAN